MTTTTPPTRPDPTRSGAVWVTGMGAFLLLAAAAVFTAVRWDQIPDAAKLAALVAATGGCLLAGRALKPSLPATAGALFHLGAFLVPVDVAAVGVRVELSWPTMLLAQGLVATATFAWAAAAERSIVLRWAAAASAVALAGGIGATTALPAPVVLAAFAVAALAGGLLAPATGWAALAGAAPLLATLDDPTRRGIEVLRQLGLAGEQPRLTAVVTGLLAAVVLAVVGRRRGDAGLAILGIGAAGLGTLVSWTGVERSAEADLVAVASAFLLAQTAAWALRVDPFWRQPARAVARTTDLLAALTLPFLGLCVVLVTGFGDPEPLVALAVAIGGLGWLAADLGRADHRGRRRAAVGMAVSAAATVAFATASGPATGAAMVAIALVAAALPDRAPGGLAPSWATASEDGWRAWPGGHLVTAGFAAAGPGVAASDGPWLAIGLAVAAVAALTEAAVRRSQTGAAGSPEAARSGAWALLLALGAVLPGLTGVELLLQATDRTAPWLALGVVLLTLVGTRTDRARDAWLGLPVRVGAVALLAAAADLPRSEIGLLALVVVGCSVADALRADRPELSVGAVVALPVAVAALGHAAGLSLPTTGVALTVAAAVLGGLTVHLPDRWAEPAVGAMGLLAGAGLALASGDVGTLGDAVVVCSGIVLALAVLVRNEGLGYGAGTAMVGGVWLRLAHGGVEVSEPYVAPVALLLLAAGLRARRTGTSSWVAYGPAVGLLGGAALMERVAGGPGWHGLVAGAVAVAAVGAGGARRLAGPLLLGSGLLVGLVGYETLAITAGFPTWVWLALGGTTLLGAGVAMERHDLGPVETGRRLVDVVSERFE